VVSRETWAEWLLRKSSIAVSGISGINKFEKLNEFTAAAAFPDKGVNVVVPGHQGQGAVAFMLVITPHSASSGRALVAEREQNQRNK
jgi:hypothetical protein